VVRFFRKIHKIAGLLLGVWLFNLGFTGFFLNHDKNSHSFDFLWITSLPSSFFSEDAVKKHGKREVNEYINITNKDLKVVASMTGLYLYKDKEFKKVFNKAVFKIEPLRNRFYKEDYSTLFLATSDGVYKLKDGKFELLGLKGKVITSLSVNGNTLVAVENKSKVYVKHGTSNFREVSVPDKAQIPESVRIGRFVRDFHYGRGFLLNPASMLVNDFVSLWWLWLCLSGYLIFLMRGKISGKTVRGLIKLHSNIFTIALSLFVFLLGLTGLFIDHPKFFSSILKASVPVWSLPPVYKEAHKEIWDVDFDGESIRIGTRYGVYLLRDDVAVLESEGFAYKLFRVEDRLYVSGMGSPNRLLEGGKWKVIKNAGHMPVGFVKKASDVVLVPRGQVPFLAENLSLYVLLLSLHDGSFFDENFIYLNDAAAVVLFLLLITGFVVYVAKKKR